MRGLLAVWKYRVLTATLTGKDLKSRYRGSVLGFLWTLLNPLLLMLVYTLVFSVYMRTPVANYPLFVFSGLLPWIWFSTALSHASVAVVRDGHLLRKVNFPAEILPFTAVAASMVNFIFSLPLYLVFCLVYGLPIGWSLLFAPLLLLVQFAFLYGLGLLLAAADVFFRDVEHLTANLLTLVFFLTPILYPLTSVPERWRRLALLNPAAPLVLAWRDILFAGRAPEALHLALAAGGALLVLVAGQLLFAAVSYRFAERV